MITDNDLLKYGIKNTREIIYNPDYNLLFAEETKPGLDRNEMGTITQSGAISVDTGVFTGRSPKDKYVLLDEITRETMVAHGGQVVHPRVRQALGLPVETSGA